MQESGVQFRIDRLEVPVPEEFIEQLVAFWESIFDESFDYFRGVLAGLEKDEVRNILYLGRMENQIAGTCNLTISKSNPVLGSLGEVAISTDFSRKGIGRKLCCCARDEFNGNGGEVLFLGTTNPVAKHLYKTVGFQNVPGSIVMVLLSKHDSPQTFISDYFRESGSVSISPATADDKIGILPLLIAEHDWQVLDSNINMFSIRHAYLNSCEGLYPRYQTLRNGGQGEWFCARTNDNRVVGISTVRINEWGSCQIDGFVHERFSDSWNKLIQVGMDWGRDNGAKKYLARVSQADKDKKLRFESLGFFQTDRGEIFKLDQMIAESIILKKEMSPAF